ncbi:MAG: hypothetical protein P8L20_06455 [Flavobacteriales bacterium]|nr:hypothetical protein [Flavobacteriaceae bacterium]MDG2227358.1 hypothetical protein [Flavobacteriales bacterium]
MSLKPIIYLFLSIILISCSTNRVEDFFVPDLPIDEEYFVIDQNEGFGKELTFNFTLFKSNYNLIFDIEKSLFEEVTQNSKDNQYDSGMGMRQDQYDTFVYDNYDERVLNTIITAISESEGRKNFDLAQLLVAFVQSIPYDTNAIEPKFTVETLFNKTGDCDDKSILLAKLLSYAGYQTCLFIYEEGQHMAVGLKVDEYKDAYKDGYIFIESTGYNPIGKIPEKFADNVDIRNEDPKIIEVDIADSYYAISGYDELKYFYSLINDKYGEGYFKTTVEGRIIYENMTTLKVELSDLESTLDDLKNEIDIKRNSLDQTNTNEVKQFNKLVDQYNAVTSDYENKIVSFNKLISRINQINSNNYIK